MSNSEDYLDSLLAQASLDIDSDSAISRVSEITKKAEEAPADATNDLETLDLENFNIDNAEEVPNDSASLVSETIDEGMSEEDIASLLESLEGFEDSSSEIDNTDVLDDLASLLESESIEKTDNEVIENEPTETGLDETESADSDLFDLDSLVSELENLDASEAAEEDINLDEFSNTDVAPDTSSSDFDMSNMTQDEIEQLINSASDVSNIMEEEKQSEPQGEMEIDIDDLDSLEALGIFDKDSKLNLDEEGSEEETETNAVSEEADLTFEDEDLKEITSMISSSNDEAGLSSEDDLMNLLELEEKRQNEEAERKRRKNLPDSEENDVDEENLGEGNPKDKKTKGKKSKDKKKPKKNAESDGDSLDGILDDSGENEKKPGFIARILAFLTASDEDDESTDSDNVEIGFEDIQGENKAILEEIDNQGEEKSKKKDKKDKKDKKAKKSKKEKGAEESEDEDGTDSSKGKKKKPKKEKVKKEPEPDNSKPLNKKNVIKIFIMAATLLLLILLVVLNVPSVFTAKTARSAYYKGDYETTYTEFFGEKLSESDQILFDRSKTILAMEHKYSAFCAYNKMGMKPEALDQLLQAVDEFDDGLLDAELYGCTEEFKKAYSNIITALDVTFSMSIDDAKAVIALPTDLEYSLMVESIVNGTTYIDPNIPLPEPFVPETSVEYEDMLTEEGL